ncbi:MAG TPA: hypothetical protein VN578_04355 [Candidatus Binatia bacterium]|jgi:hypothetical protein|nr:hypothetical protein [Candidatus Binatia bacterium]
MRCLCYMLLAVAAWSGCPPAGASVALAHTRLDDGRWQIWLAKADGSGERRLTSSPWDKRSLRAVPGHGEVVFRDNEGRIYRRSLDSAGQEARVDLGFEVVKDFDFDPRFGWLIAAYAPNALDNVCIWRVPPEGGAKRLLIPDPYLNETPRWLGGPDAILFAKGHAGKSWLCVSPTAHPKAQILLGEGFWSASDPDLSPDGTEVVFCGRKGKTVELWLSAVKTPSEKRIFGGKGLVAEPSWSPEGNWIYFSIWEGKNFRLGRIQPNGTDFAYVSPEGADCRCPVLVSINGGKDE